MSGSFGRSREGYIRAVTPGSIHQDKSIIIISQPIKSDIHFFTEPSSLFSLHTRRTMTLRNLYLVTFHVPSDKWKHLAIFVFNTGDSKKGTLIHVIGNPPTGYTLQFQRNYDPTANESFQKIILIGKIAANYVADPKSPKLSNDNVPRGRLEVIASRIPPPTVGDYMAPFKGVGISQDSSSHTITFY